MEKTRFTRDYVLCELEEQIVALQTLWGFHADNGTAQLAGRPPEVWLAYGQYSLLNSLYEQFDGGN